MNHTRIRVEQELHVVDEAEEKRPTFGVKVGWRRRHDARSRHRLEDRSQPGDGVRRRPGEWQGIEHCVTVRTDDFEYLGRPYKSLSSVAREITGTKWNGWVFFGLKTSQAAK